MYFLLVNTLKFIKNQVMETVKNEFKSLVVSSISVKCYLV